MTVLPTPIKRAYLDWNATAPLRPAAHAAMIAALDLVGNPSSVHAEGRASRALIEDARDGVAALVGARPADIVFTSGATEANASVLAGGWDTIFLTGIEHDSVLGPARASGARLVWLPVLPTGLVDVGALADEVLRGTTPLGRSLVSVQLANNETGIIQPVSEITAFCRSHGIAIHTDAVQAPGRIALDVDALRIDFMSLSAHKLGGPKGVGALVLRDGAPLPALITGGGQERRRRSGTENLPGIAGFGAAARLALDDLARTDDITRRRDHLEASLANRFPDVHVIGATTERLANTSCMVLGATAAETLVIRYDLVGVAISAGAACSSGKVGASAVLTAMGLRSEIARAAIRVSIGATTTDDDIAVFLAASETILRSTAKAA